MSLERQGEKSFQLQVIPVEAGLIQITLSKLIQSTTQQRLAVPPSISFQYSGISVISSELSKLDQTQARVAPFAPHHA